MGNAIISEQGKKEAGDIISRALSAFRETYYQGDIPHEILEELPLVEGYRKARPAKETFDDVEVLFVQHHLGPFIPRLKAMFDEDLDEDSCWFVDIPYSTCRAIHDKIRELSDDKKQVTELFEDPFGPYSEIQKNRALGTIRKLMTRMREKDDHRLLVVDDGAYFMRALQEMPADELGRTIKTLRDRTSIVEQTTRGYRFLKQRESMEIVHALNAPVVSIARGYTKTNLESHFIGACVVRGVLRELRKAGKTEIRKALVIGFGTVGQETTQELIENEHAENVDVFDTNPETADGIREARAQVLPSFPLAGSYDLVLGCTGYASFPIDRLSVLAEDALLMSGSSGAVELNREDFVTRADKSPDDVIRIIDKEKTLKDKIHGTITMRHKGGICSFANAGFPVNFDGKIECLPPKLIQPTHALLFAASREALRTKGSRLTFLNFEDDFWIYENGLEMIRDYSGE